MKKKILLLSGIALIVLVLASLAGATLVSAQEPTPTPGVSTPGWRGGGRGGGGGGFLFGWARGGNWTMFDTAAEALGLTPVELFTELHAGKTLEEIAEAQGVDIETVYDALDAAQAEAHKQAIEQAVEDGKISQEQADWMLEGLEKGFFPRGRGFGHRGCPPPSNTE